MAYGIYQKYLLDGSRLFSYLQLPTTNRETLS